MFFTDIKENGRLALQNHFWLLIQNEQLGRTRKKTPSLLFTENEWHSNHVDLRSLVFIFLSCLTVHFALRAKNGFVMLVFRFFYIDKKQKVTLYILFPQAPTVVRERQVGNMHDWLILPLEMLSFIYYKSMIEKEVNSPIIMQCAKLWRPTFDPMGPHLFGTIHDLFPKMRNKTHPQFLLYCVERINHLPTFGCSLLEQ